MKFKIPKETLKAIAFTLILCVLAVFAFEVVLIAEVVGTEFAVTFVLLYYKQLYFDLREKCIHFKHELAQQLRMISDMLFFQPKAYGITASASCLFVILSGSTFFACAIWLPAVALGAGVA